MEKLNLSLSGSSSATSGLSGNFRDIFGDKFAGGVKLNPWIVGGVLLALVAGLAIWATRRKKQ